VHTCFSSTPVVNEHLVPRLRNGRLSLVKTTLYSKGRIRSDVCNVDSSVASNIARTNALPINVTNIILLLVVLHLFTQRQKSDFLFIFQIL
jgi:hypothetical protein